jgi:F-type H+-transporting ATPase subunit delta
MNQGLIPRRYAKALMQQAVELGVDSQLYDVMQSVSRAFADTPELQRAMDNPHVAAADKQALAQTVADATVASAPAKQLLSDFAKLLTQNRRMGSLRDIALAYQTLYRQAKKIYRVCVTTASALPAAESSRLRSLVERQIAAMGGGTAEFSEAVDSQLIGGFTISIDNDVLDASVANELKQLQIKLLSH